MIRKLILIVGILGSFAAIEGEEEAREALRGG